MIFSKKLPNASDFVRTSPRDFSITMLRTASVNVWLAHIYNV